MPYDPDEDVRLHAAAPTPQVEGTMSEAEYKVQKEKFDSDWADKVGAAPAETARPVCPDCKMPLPHAGVSSCIRNMLGETAGEMTAEQFWPTWDVNRDRHGNYSTDYWLALADAHAKKRVEQAERRAETELREMREAAEKLVTKLRRIFDS